MAKTMWTVNFFLTCVFCMFVWSEYPREVGYTNEARAELQNKINGLTPLSIADLGYDAN